MRLRRRCSALRAAACISLTRLVDCRFFLLIRRTPRRFEGRRRGSVRYAARAPALRTAEQADVAGDLPRDTSRSRPRSVPPPPKQPHSICRPRAQADAIPTMNATSSTDEIAAVIRVARPTPARSPITISRSEGRSPRPARWPQAAVDRHERPARSRPGSGIFSQPAAIQTPADDQSRQQTAPSPPRPHT